MARNDKKPVVLIMAGGKGERFWPRSTASYPKQLHAVYSAKSLLQETIDRAKLITDKSRIYIGCNAVLKKAVLKTHTFPEENFIVEPEGKNTAPIIALAALEFEKRFPGAIHVILSADHFISTGTEFKSTVKKAIEAAQADALVTIGIRPSRPETGYGYIRAKKTKNAIKPIEEFVEKPDLNVALQYIRKGNYLWNTGIFVWKGSAIIEQFQIHAEHIMGPIRSAGKSGLKKVFAALPSEPVDIAIMEKAENCAVVEAEFTWDDVGSWTALERIVASRQQGNVLVGKSNFTSLNASSNVVATDRNLVALLGVNDLIIVETDDVLFVTSKEGVSGIKSLLGQMRENPTLQKYLK